LTPVTLYDNLDRLVVRPLWVGPEYRTAVWASDEVLNRVKEWIEEEPKDSAAWLKKARFIATAGFLRYEGDRGIRPKSSWPGIFAIEPWATLFRMYGFYEDVRKTTFIVPSCTMKTGGKMNRTDKRECDFAHDIKESGLWIKETSG